VTHTEDIDRRLARAGLPPLPRRAWLEIDVEALATNFGVVRAMVGGDVAIWAVVKADAYGHGIEYTARTFIEAGAERLCVATVDEGLHLRRVGIQAPIMVIFEAPRDALEAAVAGRLELTGSDARQIAAGLEWWAARGGRGLALHLEIETGLGRGGVMPADAGRIARRIADTPGARLAGAWTHLAAAQDGPGSAAQVSAFGAALDSIADAGVEVPVRHAAASGALLARAAPVFDAVRPGLVLYGLLPADVPLDVGAQRHAGRLSPAMSLKARPARLQVLPAGSGVSYDSRWRAPRESLVASLPLGYGDGWARAYWPGGSVLVRGRRAPLVGVVAMDAVMADVTDIPEVGADDEFVLLGRQGDDEITVAELARLRNTNSWEVVTAMAQRLPRVYHARAVPMAVRTLMGMVHGASAAESAPSTEGEENG
jgi:alanine racemase